MDVLTRLRRILVFALAAGAVAGVATTLVQHFTTLPLVHAAESLEARGEPSDHQHGSDTSRHGAMSRSGYTLLFNILAAVGFGLLLAACFSVAGRVNAFRGALWGLAGFAAFGLAPALGLPPELPGTAAAGLLERQIWWIGTGLATSAGVALAIWSKRSAMKVAGLALIVLPHLIGAPQVPHAAALGPPADLARAFIVASLVATAVLWIVLGSVLGWLYGRELP